MIRMLAEVIKTSAARSQAEAKKLYKCQMLKASIVAKSEELNVCFLLLYAPFFRYIVNDRVR